MNSIELAQLAAIGVAAASGWVIPGVVDLITTSKLAKGVKAFFSAVLSALAGALATVTITPATHWQTVLIAVALAFSSTMAAHRTGYSNVVQRITTNVGIGPKEQPADPLADTGSAGYSAVELLVIVLVVVVILVVLLRVL